MGTFDAIHDFNVKNPTTQINIRAGINTGSVIAGVIGTKKFAYDLWGDAVNTASRIESTSLSGRIQISRSTYERVHDLGFEFEERYIEVKGKGMTTCYLLNDKHHTKPLPTPEEIEDLAEMSEPVPQQWKRKQVDGIEEEVSLPLRRLAKK
ncbi:predicted protein [Naegleria gruberi]|uniref:Predicted protein n=1 Tax=Naegleria gruberi TaxID=5762 RepID=D2VS19_NAEGR|nr:uncharacterized protein NAEGRDRAFT_51803 [Naegleria gruberi]EFC40344.1 predicted protein [Naegleria gruberi]|eukprot:XP_002673088.1 predicted protein [Naegleria gruberi strain NEG-M]